MVVCTQILDFFVKTHLSTKQKYNPTYSDPIAWLIKAVSKVSESSLKNWQKIWQEIALETICM